MKSLKLTNSRLAVKVDDEDFERFQYSTISLQLNESSRYANITSNDGRSVGLHTIILPVNYPFEVHHIDGDGLNNQKSNLQALTHGQNLHQRAKISKICASKYVGVTWCKQEKKWKASIKKDGKTYNLGRFKFEKWAAQSYNKKAIELYGALAKLNILEDEVTQ